MENNSAIKPIANKFHLSVRARHSLQPHARPQSHHQDIQTQDLIRNHSVPLNDQFAQKLSWTNAIKPAL